MSKPFPAPWLYEDGHIYAAEVPGYGTPHVADVRGWGYMTGHLDMWGEAADAEQERVGRLMAASPDLLAALESAVEQYGKPGGPWSVPDDPGGWLALARAALKKARGET